MVLLEANGLTREPVFRDIDLALDAGEILVLTGPSGSGKTLLLRSLADLDSVDRGECVLEGESCADVSPQRWRRRVRYVHQRSPRLGGTVGESLERVRRSLDLREAFDTLPPGLTTDQRTSDLSGGEGQKLALFIALNTGARVLLLDEPTSALDEESALAAERSVVEYARDGHAVLWVSHDSSLAERLGADVRSLA